MATYKVIQDIEAEDKFLGPLTLKQFVFGIAGIFFGYLNIFVMQRGLPYATLIFTPPMLLAFFLAVPWSKDQPTEVWVLAKLRFYFKPRRRIWDQTGMEELVSITVPKKEEKQLVDNLSKTEVKSRLQILAETIDSRGWAIKDAQMKSLVHPADTQDRLISPATLPHEVPPVDLASIPDVYDLEQSSVGNFDRMIQQSAEVRKAHSLETMEKARQETTAPNPGYANPPAQFTPPTTDYQTFTTAQQYSQPPAPTTQDEYALSNELKSHQVPNIATSHMRTIQPIDPNAIYQEPQSSTMQPTVEQNNIPSNPIPTPPSPAILELANNNDLDVATLARQAKREIDSDPNEVVISLH